MRSKPPSAAKTQRRRRPAPPKAEVRTKTTQVHGVTLRDDYDWLRAANWKEVLREPKRCPPTSAPISRPRTPMRQR